MAVTEEDRRVDDAVKALAMNRVNSAIVASGSEVRLEANPWAAVCLSRMVALATRKQLALRQSDITSGKVPIDLRGIHREFLLAFAGKKPSDATVSRTIRFLTGLGLLSKKRAGRTYDLMIRQELEKAVRSEGDQENQRYRSGAEIGRKPEKGGVVFSSLGAPELALLALEGFQPVTIGGEEGQSSRELASILDLPSPVLHRLFNFLNDNKWFYVAKWSPESITTSPSASSMEQLVEARPAAEHGVLFPMYLYWLTPLGTKAAYGLKRALGLTDVLADEIRRLIGEARSLGPST